MSTQLHEQYGQEQLRRQEPSVDEVCALLDETIAKREEVNLGPTVDRHDIPSRLAPFHTYPEHPVRYPEAVVGAFQHLLHEHNVTLQPTIQKNLEEETEWDDRYYRYVTTPDGFVFNPFAQIDARGLPEEFLEAVNLKGVSADTMVEVLRRNTFEVEVSLAMVQMLRGINPLFNEQFVAALDVLRERNGKPIALLAVTDPKYESMASTEFGDHTDPESVRAISGFDALLSPAEFQDLVRRYGDEVPYQLYVRPSLPTNVLRDPTITPPPTILDDDRLRRIVKINTITPNIDHNGMTREARLNDTKKNQPAMGLSYPAFSADDLRSPGFAEFLMARGIHPDEVTSGRVVVRGKPMEASYGAHNHLRDPLWRPRLPNQLQKRIDKHGPYVLQPELTNPTLYNQDNGNEYRYIHRIFVAAPELGGQYLGGFKNMIPTSSQEVRGDVERIHGNGEARWRPIM